MKSDELIEILFILPKEYVIRLHVREKHRQEKVEFGPQGSTFIPLPYRRRLKSQAASSRTSSQNVDGRVKWEPLIQLSIVKRVWSIAKSIIWSQCNGAETLL